MNAKRALGVFTVPLLSLLVGCGGVFDAKTKSFTTYKSVYDSLDDNNSNQQDDNGSLDFSELFFGDLEVRKNCHIGELDLLSAFAKCKDQDNIIITIKDKNGEKTILKVPSDINVKKKAKLAKYLKNNAQSFNFSVASDFDLFVCIDSDNDGECTDEALYDLDNLNAMALEFIDSEMARKKGQCDRFNALNGQGLLVYHKHISLDQLDGTSDKTADVVASMLRNEEPNDAEMAAACIGPAEPFPLPGLEEPELPIRKNTVYEDEEGNKRVVVVLNVSDEKLCRPRPRTNGCFVKGTKINLTKEISLPVEKLREGTSVLLANGKKSKIKKIIKGPELKPVYQITTLSKKTVTLTETHPMLTENGIVMAKQLKLGEKLKLRSGQWDQIQSIKLIDYKDQVYNFELAGDLDSEHLIYANDIVSGDLYLQNKLTNKEIKNNLAFTKDKK